MLSRALALCLPHLHDVCSCAKDGGAVRSLVQLHRAKYERMREQMSALIQKQSYDHRSEETSEEEKGSWLRAIEALMGQRGVH